MSLGAPGADVSLGPLLARLDQRAAAAEEESVRSYEAGDQLMATWWDGRRQGLEDAARQLRQALGLPDA